MKKISILLAGLLLGLLFSCKKDETNSYSVNGIVQKGPFITGTSITLNEMNSSLGQTGRSFTSSINNDDGSFSLNNVELNSGLSLLTANGFFFSEIYGELSGATLSLQALTDLNQGERVNINVLTHLVKGRIENLVNSGLGFKEANDQAKSEFLIFLGVPGDFDGGFENLTITGEEEYNAVLLAFSIILQRYTQIWNERPSLTAELTQLLSNLSSDFATDGSITEPSLIDTLLYNVSQLNLSDIRENIENRYSDLGKTVTIPDFEKYIGKFQEKHSNNLYTSFFYPDIASPFPDISPDGKIPNLLVPKDTVFQAGAYSVAAIIPLNKELKIKFIGTNYTIGGPTPGWEIIKNNPNGFTLISQRQNQLMSMLLHLEDTGNATIEYYENETDIPTSTKKISWE